MPLTCWIADDEAERRAQAETEIKACLGQVSPQRPVIEPIDLRDGVNEPLPPVEGTLLVVLDIDAKDHPDAGVKLYRRILDLTSPASTWVIVWSYFVSGDAVRRMEKDDRRDPNLFICRTKSRSALHDQVTAALKRMVDEAPETFEA